MDNNNLQEETVIDEGRRLHNVLTFQDFVLEESKKSKHDPKKNKSIVKNRKNFIDNMGEDDDLFDPNNALERYVKIREEFIKDELQ
jgi:hypothetical protein